MIHDKPQRLPALETSQIVQADMVNREKLLPGFAVGGPPASDRVSRQNAILPLAGRVPFLDPRVADLAYRLPDRLKVRKNLGKWALRRWLDGKLPEARPFTPKRGFTVPVGEWIAGRGRRLGALVAAQPGVAEACRPDAVTALFEQGGKKAGKAAWTLLFFALWHNCHILGQPSGDDVLDALTAR